MKKNKLSIVSIGAIMIVLLLSFAKADSTDFFKKIIVNKGLRLAVYSAPSTSSWRGANGKAMCNSDGVIYVGGRDGDWVMIMYYLNHGPNDGGARVGYVQYSELIGLKSNIEPLPFRFSDATINSRCYLTDDPIILETAITYLPKGEHVTYLFGYKNKKGVRFGYIETTFMGQRIRGFVPYEALNINN